jgi:hypothetical protein
MDPRPDRAAANLNPIGQLMAFIGVPSVRDEMTLATHHADQFVDTHPLVRFQQHLFMWEVFVDFWRQNQETSHAD